MLLIFGQAQIPVTAILPVEARQGQAEQRQGIAPLVAIVEQLLHQVRFDLQLPAAQVARIAGPVMTSLNCTLGMGLSASNTTVFNPISSGAVCRGS